MKIIPLLIHRASSFIVKFSLTGKMCDFPGNNYAFSMSSSHGSFVCDENSPGSANCQKRPVVIRVLSRPKSLEKSSSSSSSPLGDGMEKQKQPLKSLAQREREYAAARQRIFGNPETVNGQGLNAQGSKPNS